MRIALLTLLVFIFAFRASAQLVTIYSEDFSTYPDGTTGGNGWSAGGTDCDGQVTSRFGVYGGRFEWRDMEGSCGCGPGGQTDNEFIVGPIPISGCNVTASIAVAGAGSFECDSPGGPDFSCNNSHDQLVVEYSVNGGAYTRFPNGYVCGGTNLGLKTITGITGNTLSIRVTGGNKAQDEVYFISSISIRGTANATVAISGPTSVCTGGSINLSATGGFASYIWNPNGETSQSIAVTTPGTYRVTATTAGGCQATATRTITTAAPPVVTLTSPAQICSGGIGAVSVVQNFSSYAWSTGGTTRIISISEPGTYTVTVTDANGCTNIASRTVNPGTPPTANINGPTALCTGGSINLTATGGTSYRWSTGATTAGISVNRGGTYTVTVTNALGCTAETSRDVTESPRPSLSSVAPQSACGAFVLPAINGSNLTGNESYYTAPNGGGTALAPGEEITNTRTVYVYDAVPGLTGCSSQQSFLVTITTRPDLDDITNKTACDRFVLPPITGTIVTGARAYYTGPNGTGTRFNPGDSITTNRTLYAFDGTATCNDQKQFTVTITRSPRVNDLRDTAICAAYTLPAITGTNLSGNQAYYTQTNGAGTRFNPGQVITATQTLFIFDRNGTCSSEQTVNINITSGPKINTIRDTMACLSYTLPAITGITLTGNQAYFTGPGGTGTRLNPGQAITTTQTLYAYDAQGTCSSEDTFRITIVNAPTVNDLRDTTNCNFFILPIISGTDLSGEESYYTQSSGAGIRYRAGDTIQITVTTMLFIYDGAPGCSDEESVAITILPAPDMNAIPDTAVCTNFILPVLSGTNLSANAAYFTQPNGTGTRFAAGDTIKTNTTLYAFDTNGTCADQDTFTIAILPAPILNPINDTVVCTAFVLPTIRGTGLTANAAYFTQNNGAGTRFAPGDTIKTTTNLFAFNTNGSCKAEEAFRVEITTNPIASVTADNVSCNGAQDGALEVTVLGNAPFIFNWNVDVLDGQQNATGVPAGNYSVTITDAKGCVTNAAATITQPTPLNLQCAPLNPVSMIGATDGSARLLISGGTAPYNVILTGPTPRTQPTVRMDTLVLNNLAAGSYEATVRDSNGCTTTCNFAVNTRGCNITLDFVVGDATCPNKKDGSVRVTLTGAVLPIKYDWNVDSLDGRANLTGLAPGNYVLNATDSSGCIVTGNIAVASSFSEPQAAISYQNVVCENECFLFDLSLVGTPPFNLDYQLSTPVGDIFRTLTINSLSDTLELCPAAVNADSGYVIVQFLRLRDANCELELNLRDTLFVRPISRDTIAQTLCSTDSVVVNGGVYDIIRPNGVERFPGAAANGCDSVIVINLTFRPPVVFDLNPTICTNDSLVVNGKVYNQANSTGTETLVGAAANGCDSTINVRLGFFPPVIFDLNRTICESDSLVVNGTVYNQLNPNGTETLAGAAVDGCDSIVNVRLQFFPPATFLLRDTICETDSLVLNGTIYNQFNSTGTERLAGLAANGCDSIINVVLQFIPTPIFIFNQTICENDSVVVNGTLYNQANPTGTETLLGASVAGCDSLVNINLQFFPTAAATLNRTICENDSLVLNGKVYNQTNPRGQETLIGASANGCDSIVNVNLNFFPTAIATLNQTLCETDSIVVNGRVYSQRNPRGTERLVGRSSTGCDSIINVTLQFFPTAAFNLDSTLCEGDSLVVNGKVYNEAKRSGTERLLGASVNGCDSVINIRLTFRQAARTTIDTTLCPSDSLRVNGKIYNAANPSGREIIKGGASNGCDSITQINLRFFAPATFNLTQRICETDSLVVNGRVYNKMRPSGIERLVGASAKGCDSLVNINLQFFSPVTFALNEAICENDSIVVNGRVYNSARPTGTEIFPGATGNGCDSIVTVNLTFFPPVTFALNQTICENDSIVVNGTVYNVANPRGTETLVGAAANGCDSIVNVNLQFFRPIASNLTRTICESDSLVLNGTVYNRANPRGTATLVGAGANGCDSVVNVSLTFFSPTNATLNQTLCAGDSLILNGKVYNQANPRGTETLKGATRNGCDSVVTVNLTFLQAVERTLDTLVCPGESLVVNGKTFNESNPNGREILRDASATGCDSIVQVNLRFRAAVRGFMEGNATICAGATATLTFRLSGAQTFDIRYSDGKNNSIELRNITDGHTVQVTPASTTTYTINFIAVNGSACPAQIGSSVTVQVSNLTAEAVAVSNFAGFGVSCADATDGRLQANSNNGIAPFVYRWNTGTVGQQLQNVGAGTYSVTVLDAAGCSATDSITLTQPAAIVVSSSPKSPNCAKDKTGSIRIDSIRGGASPFEVSLNGTSYRAVNGFPYELGNLAAGNYKVFVRDANDCELQFESNIIAPSEPKLDLGPDITVKLGDSVELAGLVNFEPTSIEWRPDTFLTAVNTLRTIVTPMETTTYTLTVSDTSGCRASDQITVFLNRARGVYIPTAFTPGGDGANDVFFINAGNDVQRIKEFRVFDRWGNLMFHRSAFQPNDPQFGWNGTFNNSKVNIGVYVYYAEIEFIDGFVEVFQGDITVVR